ncbi:MAG: sulfide:quinone oxidoreductase [Actinomycetota bacterium]|jgi:sulfide:quinone oxidoreductase|nr:sulfide:quinone oxidoreductase [Actinomycetota bacterium]
MRKLLILGGGTAGTMTANKLHRALPESEWEVTVVDADDNHRYQPGYLFMPFGTYRPDQVTRSRRKYVNKHVPLVYGEIDTVLPDENAVVLADGRRLDYDFLIIATGVTPRPDQTPGMLDGGEWRRSVHEFYSYDGSVALADKLREWPGGRLVIHITEMPIKCPVAPLEFAFLADAYFKDKGMRDKVEITYVTPLDAAFTKPIAAEAFGNTLEEKGITVVPDFMIESVDAEGRRIVAYDETEVPFDLLVTIPLNMGADYVGRSGLGNDLNLVPVDKFTQQAKAHDNIFALGDANDIPASKAGSVAHFEVDVFVENFVQLIAGEAMTHKFDGHANCFIETGDGKAMLIDFNYDTEPLPGKFPYGGLGPMGLLKESHLNHLGKLAFKWVYWNMLMPGRPLPLSTAMSLSGKQTELIDAK